LQKTTLAVRTAAQKLGLSGYIMCSNRGCRRTEAFWTLYIATNTVVEKLRLYGVLVELEDRLQRG
jgi:hypothetical protein